MSQISTPLKGQRQYPESGEITTGQRCPMSNNGPEDKPQSGAPEKPGEIENAQHRAPADARKVRKRTTHGPSPTLVGIGASAGGLAALTQFFKHVPSDSDLAFVVVVHLSPEYKSHLADLIQPHAAIPVTQVTDTTSIEPNRVYIIPPNANLSAVDTHLRLSKLETERRERAPIDNFFRTMAATHDGNAVGVILTGTGSDGTLGIKDIKAKGGLIIIQDPNEAEYDGMPQSAMNTGLVDRVLPLVEIPDAIIRYDRTKPDISGAKEEQESAPEDLDHNEQALLQKVFAQLQSRTDRDFTRYKTSTLLRRIARRMQLHYINDFPTYIDKLRVEPEEVKALADDFLITVTNFFRDREVFDRLQAEVIPRLFRNRGRKDCIRVWSVGCATGEEAYSLAMLLVEEAERHENPAGIQIFASDLHTRSLDRGREGLYSGDIATDVSAERLDRYFQKENGGYRVRKELRDLVIFAPHNLLRDPPFSKLDLITCRNLLIYLQRHAQRDVIELFHYALNPEGCLLLGIVEAIDIGDLFRTEDKRVSLYRKRNVPGPDLRLPVFSMLATDRLDRQRKAPDEPGGTASWGIVHQKMLELYAPPSILVGFDDRVVHYSESAGRYVVHPGGEPTTNIFKLVREELRVELRTALQAARQNGTPVDSTPTLVRFNGRAQPVVLRVLPSLTTEYGGVALIIFEERDAAAGQNESRLPDPVPDAATGPSRVEELERELLVARQRVQALIEEYETSREEMRASSEEMQSTNEELRSTMEELETSKEELQSINEELQTVNQENRHKVEELSQLSSDLQNLLTATDIATLFLDRELRILRFTPKLSQIFNIRVQDRGRPISDLTHRLGSLELQSDAEAVLSRLTPVEREVQDGAGHWFLTRLLPYRSVDDRIMGVVVTFVDITARRNAEETLRANEQRLRKMISVDVVGVLIFDEKGTLIDSNEAFQKMCGYSREEIASKTLTWRVMTPPEYVEASEIQLQMLRTTGRLGPYEKEYLCKDGSRSWMVSAGAALGDGTVIEYCIDVTDRKNVEAELLRAKKYAESIIETLHEPLLVLTPGLRVRSANPAFYRFFEVTPETTLGNSIYELGNGQWNIPELRELLQEVVPDNKVFQDFEVAHSFNNIGEKKLLLNARKLEDLQLVLLGIRDVTDERKVTEELRASEQRFRLFVESVNDYAMFQLDFAGTIRSWNAGAERLLGWTEQEAIGMNVSRMFTPEDIAAAEPVREIQTARTTGRAEDERWHMRKDGRRFFASGVLTQVRNEQGSVIALAKVMRDVTDRKEYEEQLKRAVEEKSTLVREIHHRVKNNLQVIVSLLNMQASHAKQADVVAAFEEAEGRLQAIARIHERLYASSNLADVEFSAYLRNLTKELVRLHSSDSQEIAVKVEATEVVLPMDHAIPLGLIANELVINSLKHGMRNGTRLLEVRFGYVPGSYRTDDGETPDDGWASLEVCDAGPGFPPEYNQETTASFGMRLVNLLVRQLGGRLEVNSRTGAHCIVRFPLKSK